jgi:hypothetical protein
LASVLTPFIIGPRHCGQFSARTAPAIAHSAMTVATSVDAW